MIRARRLHERIKPRAYPEQATDATPASLGVSQDHQSRGGDMPEPPRGQIAAVEPFKHVGFKVVETEQWLDLGGLELRSFGKTDRAKPEVGDGQRHIPTEPAAQPRAVFAVG